MRGLVYVSCLLWLFGVSCTGGKEEPAPTAATPPQATPGAQTSASTPSGELVLFRGKVTYKGAPGKPQIIKMSGDAVCAKQNAGKTVTESPIEVGAQNGLQRVFVYVKEGVKEIPPLAPDAPAVTLDQKGCIYTPRVLGIRVNQPLKIMNSDPTLHNVHAFAKQNPSFNIGMPTKDMASTKTFTKPEVMIRFKCDVHGWMAAYVGVVEHPYFAVSDTNGEFQIAGLPAGDYTLEAWHEKLGTKTLKVSVSPMSSRVEEIQF